MRIIDCRTVERQLHHIYTYTYLYTYLIYNLAVQVHRQKPLSHSLSTGIGTIHTTRFHFHAILNEERNGNAFFSSPCYVNNELILNPLLLQMRVEQYIPDTTSMDIKFDTQNRRHSCLNLSTSLVATSTKRSPRNNDRQLTMKRPISYTIFFGSSSISPSSELPSSL